MLPWDDEVSAASGPGRLGVRELQDRLGAFIEARPVKLLIGALIILSLLPPDALPRAVEARLQPLFLLVFGVEVLIRGALLVTAGPRRRGVDYVFLLFDVVAFLSFLPPGWFGAGEVAQVLPLLRLARLLVLIRFVSGLARDVYLILTRREQLLQFGMVTLFVAAVSLLSGLLLYHGKIRHEDDNGRLNGSLRDALWWSFRQMESADNLLKLLDDKTPLLALFLSLALTIIGVFVISFLIGIGASVVEQVMRAERRRPVGYKGHALVVGPVEDSELLVREFVTLYDKNRMLRRVRPREVFDWLFRGGPRPRRHALPRMVLLGRRDDPPPYLYEEMMRWVVYRQGDGADPAALRLVGGAAAKRVLILSRHDAGPDADALSIASLAALRAENRAGHVFVEVQDERSRHLVEDVGGPGTFPLEAPRMAGLFLCQHLVVPGVDRLYRELMDDVGAEFYTHVYVDAREIGALRRQGTEARFSTMAARAYREHGVTLAGVFLGEGDPPRLPGNLVPTEGLHQWVNPLVLPDEPRLRALGAAPDTVPLQSLRGLIGVCASYRPLRQFGRELARGQGRAPGPRKDPALAEALAGCGPDLGGLRRVLLCGFSTALPSLLAELDRFVPGVEALIVLGERDDEHTPLRRKLELLGLGLGRGDELPGDRGAEVRLPRGGRARVFTHEGPNLTEFAVRCMGGPVDAAVFLSELDAADRDARTGLRVLRFAEALESGAAPRGERLHLLCEFVSRGKGERIQQILRRRFCGFPGPDHLRVTIISTEHIKNYFMVRSAFVPGLTALFTELLAQEGQAVYRIGLPDLAAVVGRSGALGLDAFREALRGRGLVPLALELAGGRVALNPAPAARFPAGELRGLYVLRDAER